MIILFHYEVSGLVVLSIVAGTLLAIPLKVADLDILLGKKIYHGSFG
jgi:xanthine/uracil/vitamin C permease (AzgA family)